MSFLLCMETLEFDFTSAPDPVLFDENLVASYGRMLDADCDEGCDLDCVAAVSENSRRMVYEKFDGLADARTEQNLYLCACIELEQCQADAEEHIIEQTVAFWLGDQVNVKVCKTFFARTLGLPDARLDALLEPDTYQWFLEHKSSAAADDRQRQCHDFESRSGVTDFVLNSRKYLEKNHSAFDEETNSDIDVSLDDITSVAYNSVINHIQRIPRVISTLKNPNNDKEEYKFESSISCHYMYLNYLQSLKKNKKKVSEKQYKKIYNNYVKIMFMK